MAPEPDGGAGSDGGTGAPGAAVGRPLVRRIKVEMALVSGGVTPEEVEQAVKAALPGIGGCLEHSGLGPWRFTAELLFDARGPVHVDELRWGPGLRGPDECPRRGLGAIRLGARERDGRATYTVRFDVH